MNLTMSLAARLAKFQEKRSAASNFKDSFPPFCWDSARLNYGKL